METKKQGIGSILGSDCESIKSPLRRTLSADMSSKKWQSQHSLKKVASFVSISEYSSSSSSSSDEEPRGQLEIWSSIQEEKKKKELENPGQLDIWSSILFQKEAEGSTEQPIPYVHPLVRRSTSTLSEKSLEICTESLGSETGSDGFSSYSPSETSDVKENKEVVEEESQEQKPYEMDAWRAVKYNTTPAPAASKKSSPKSFPPLLPSLSRGNGASLQMRPRRDNGRLVLEAVSIPSQNNFLAQRGEGRLVLTLANSCNKQDQQMNGNGMFELDVDSCDDEEEERTDMETEEEEDVNQRESKDVEFVKEEAPKLCGEVINFHRVALMMNKPGLSLSNENSKWLNNYNEIGQVEETGNPKTSVTQSLPPRPPVGRIIPAAKITASTSALNAYEHYWKARPMSLTKDNNNKGEYSVPVSKGCKERRRSLLLWEPYCIAT